MIPVTSVSVTLSTLIPLLIAVSLPLLLPIALAATAASSTSSPLVAASGRVSIDVLHVPATTYLGGSLAAALLVVESGDGEAFASSILLCGEICLCLLLPLSHFLHLPLLKIVFALAGAWSRC